MTDTFDWTILDRHYAGDASDEDRARLDAWVAGDPSRRALLAALPVVYDRTAPTLVPRDVEPLLDRVSAHVRGGVRQGDAVTGHIPSLPRRLDRGTARMALGAAILMAVVGGTVWLAVRSHGPRAATPVAAIALAREVVTRRGERATLDLADGTHVMLAPESRLRIPADYAARTGLGARDIELDGEAYFAVRHDTDRPFRVRTSSGVAEDLGTEFVVSSYPETRGMRVVVASGEVAVRSLERNGTPTQPLALLQSGNLARLDAGGAVTVLRQIDASRYLSWTRGQLRFDATPMPEAVAALRRWYDLDIQFADPVMAGGKLSVTLHGESTQKVVALLEVLLNARAEWRGRAVMFSARRG